MKKKYGFLTLILICAVLSIGWVSGWHIHWIPETDDTYDIGSTAKSARAIYLGPNDAYIDEGACAIDLPITSFTTAGILMLGNSTPKLETDNTMTAVVWVDADVDPIERTFIVPANYHSGGRFKLWIDLSAESTDCEVDFDVYINTDDTTWDASATNQTVVQVKNVAAAATGVGSPEVVTLTVATDFASLAAGQAVTIRIWRGDASDSATADLELYSVAFEYNY